MTYQEVYLMDNLTIEAKAIYGMLCSYAGTGATAYPSVEFMCDKLHVSRARFYKHINLLLGAGIIEKQVFRDSKGLIVKTVYTLIPNTQNVKIPLLDNLTVDNLTVDNLTSNNNTINKNNLNNNNINTPSAAEQPPKPKHKYGEYNHVLLSDDEYRKLADEYGQQLTDQSIAYLDEYIEMKGYKAKNHYLAIKKWVISAVEEKEKKVGSSTGATKSNRFNNFHQRNYNMDELEQSLLQLD